MHLEQSGISQAPSHIGYIYQSHRMNQAF